MPNSRNSSLFFWTILALVFLGFVLDSLGYMGGIRASLQTVLQPAQGLMAGPVSVLEAIGQRQDNLSQLQEQNQDLQAEINRLLIENIQLRELARENIALRELLNYTRNNPGLDYTSAGVVGRVIGTDPSNLLYTIILDVGARDGIAPDMPVINSRGLVGRVVRVGPNWAQVLLLIDPASSINALIQNSRIEGIVKGELGSTLIMERIPQGVNVNVGDLVLSSGLGGKIPDKLVIGQVIEVFQEDLELFQTARVRPTVNFGDLKTLLVITAFQPVNFEEELFDIQEDAN